MTSTENNVSTPQSAPINPAGVPVSTDLAAGGWSLKGSGTTPRASSWSPAWSPGASS